MKAQFAAGATIALNTAYGSPPGARVHFRLVTLTADVHEEPPSHL